MSNYINNISCRYIEQRYDLSGTEEYRIWYIIFPLSNILDPDQTALIRAI